MSGMEFRYALGWVPISTLPIQNRVYRQRKIVRSDRTILRDKWSNLFDKYRSLQCCEFAVRLDGFFILRITHNQGLKEFNELWLELSDMVKGDCGHKHDFHTFAKHVSQPAKSGAWHWRAKRWLLRLLDELGLDDKFSHEHWDVILFIPPVEMEDPTKVAKHSSAGKTFEQLGELLEPEGGDLVLGQVRAYSDTKPGAILDQRALLRLRTTFASKKDKCLEAFNERLKRGSSILLPLVASLITLALSNFLLTHTFGVRWKTAVAFSAIPAAGAFAVIDIRRHSPKLALLQRLVGFYEYGSILSRAIERVYKSKEGFSTETGHFDGVIKTIRARYDLEKDKIERRKFFLGLFLTIFAVTVAMFKVAIELGGR